MRTGRQFQRLLSFRDRLRFAQVTANMVRERRPGSPPLLPRPAACLAVVASFLALPACDRHGDEAAQGEAPQETVTVRDSANIRIVENHAPAWDPARFWTVDPEPEIVIGGNRAGQAADDPAHLLWRLKGAALLSDGRVAVLSGGEPWVLVFDTTGVLAAAFGRKGQGPGEFSYPLHLQVLPGDTIVVWDRMWGRIGHFDPSGTLLRDRTLDLGAVFAAAQTPEQRLGESMALPLPDGTFLVDVKPGDWTPVIDTRYRIPTGFLRVDSAYATHSFGWWDGQQVLATRLPVPLLFPTEAVLAAGGSPLSVYISSGDRYEVHQFSPTGVLRRIIRRTAVEPIPILASEVEAWKARLSMEGPLDWDAWDRVVARNPPRPYRARVAGLMTDIDGNLWVANRLDEQSSEWSVFDPEGHWLGTMSLPFGRVTWITRDRIVGVLTDPDTGVESVAVHRLNRTAPR